MSIIARHKQAWAHARAQARKSSPVRSTPARGADAVWAAQVKADWDNLKAIPDHGERDLRKPALLDKYRDYLSGLLRTGSQQHSDVLAVNVIWAADAGEEYWPWLLELLDHAVSIGQGFPDWLTFKSSLLTHVADTIRNQSERVYKDSQTGVTDGLLRPFTLPAGFAGAMARIMNQQWDINFVSVAKYHKLAGLEAESNGDWQAALEHYRAAHKYPNVAVKTRLENAERMVKTVLESPPTQVSGDAATGKGAVSLPAVPVEATHPG